MSELVGWKRSTVVVDDGRVGFRSRRGGWYAAIGRAGCPWNEAHDAPEPGCSCGFYAYHDRRVAMSDGDDPSLALLQVELTGRHLSSGKVIRAARQRVIDVEFAPWCHSCSARAEGLVVGEDRLLPVCTRHTPRASVPIAGVAARLGAPAHWGEDQGWLPNLLRWRQSTLAYGSRR